MPPRIPLIRAAQCCRAPIRPYTQPTSLVSLFAGLSIQTRKAGILANLRNNPGALKKRRRLGRGPSSGRGKTSGRGHKGTGQRGKVNPWFQGGQTPLVEVWGKKGFVNHRAAIMSEVNLDRLQAWIDAGRIDPTKQITPKELIESGLVGTIEDGIKILARGKDSLRTPIDILVSRASAAAIEAIEDAGGKVVTRYYTKLALKRLVQGTSVSSSTPLPVGPEHVETELEKARKRGFAYRLPDPTKRWDIEYYRDPAHRGYLSHLLKPGESPSLYFKVPSVEKKAVSQERLRKLKEEQADKIF